MAIFEIENISNETVELVEYNTSLQAGSILVIPRQDADKDLASIRDLVSANKVVFRVLPTADEMGVLSNSVATGDLQEVHMWNPGLAPLQVFYGPLSPGDSTASDLVELWAPGSLPYRFHVLKVEMTVGTEQAGGTLTVRTEPEGGYELAIFDCSSKGLKRDDDRSVSTAFRPTAALGLFAERSNAKIVGEIYVYGRRVADED